MGPTVGWNSLLIKLFWPKLCSNGSRKGWIGLWPTGLNWHFGAETDLFNFNLIFSVCKNAFTFLEIEINFKESQLPFGWEKRIRATRKWPINSLQTHPKKGFFWGYPLPLPKWYNNWFLPIFGVCEKLYSIYNISHLLWIKSTWKM